MENRNIPPFGIGAFATCENLPQLLLVFEMMVLVLLSWFSLELAAFVLLLRHSMSAWRSVKQLIREAGMAAITVEDRADKNLKAELRVILTVWAEPRKKYVNRDFLPKNCTNGDILRKSA